MDTFTRFLYEFLSQFFSGFLTILKGFGEGIKQIFDIKSYQEVLATYQGDLSMPEWALVGMSIFCLIVVIALIFVLIYLLIRKYLK